MRQRKYEPREGQRMGSQQQRALRRSSENLMGLLQACQALIDGWDHGGAIDPTEIDRNVEHIREALDALGWIREER